MLRAICAASMLSVVVGISSGSVAGRLPMMVTRSSSATGSGAAACAPARPGNAAATASVARGCLFMTG
jgi:hypothetical protein